jgi:hypothetical protein
METAVELVVKHGDTSGVFGVSEILVGCVFGG